MDSIENFVPHLVQVYEKIINPKCAIDFDSSQDPHSILSKNRPVTIVQILTRVFCFCSGFQIQKRSFHCLHENAKIRKRSNSSTFYTSRYAKSCIPVPTSAFILFRSQFTVFRDGGILDTKKIAFVLLFQFWLPKNSIELRQFGLFGDLPSDTPCLTDDLIICFNVSV